jgi:hypothetical protein
LVWLPDGYPVSPVITAKRAPLAAMPFMTPAWPGLPVAVFRPQSPRTANENGAVEPAGSWVVNRGEASVPSRSVVPPKTR